MLVTWYHDPDLGLVEITGRCRLYQYRMRANAEEGAVAVNSLVVDDPDGDFIPSSHRLIAVEETAAEDPYDRFVFVGYIGLISIIRGPYRNGVGRQWRLEVSDLNVILSRRILLGTDNDRPAETDVERILWVESTDEGRETVDERYLSSAAPVDMSETDYTTQEAISVYNDCAQQSGKNWYVTYFGDVGYETRPWGTFGLWYDFAASAEYPSAGRLSNDPALIDNATVFPMFHEDELDIDGMRIYSTIVVPYNQTYVTANRPETQSAYAKRESTMPAENVRTAAVAQARANRYADDARTPDHRARIKTIVPRAKVNLFREGMSVEVQVTHWVEPYASEWTAMRILNREVAEISEDDHETYEIAMEVSRSVPGVPGESGPPAGSDVYGILHLSKGPYGNYVNWGFPGDTPAPGYVEQPTVGELEMVIDGSPVNASWPYLGIKSTGTGTVDVAFFATVAGVLMDNVLYSVTWAIVVNGTVVASEVQQTSGHFEFYGASQLVSIAGLAVVPDDLIQATIVCSPPTMPNFRTPMGTGQNNERLEITGGSVA